MTQTIILHIGYPSTTAIQKVLHANRDPLLRQGVFYPLVGQGPDHSHSRLAFTLFDNIHDRFHERQRLELFDQLMAEIDDSGCNTIVLSAEQLARHYAEASKSRHFARLFEGRQLKAICYLTRQDTYLESIYTQAVWSPKRKLTIPFDAFLVHAEELADYYPVIKNWAGFFGRDNLNVVIHEQASTTREAVQRLCDFAGVNIKGFKSLDAESDVVTAGAVATRVMQLGNDYELSETHRSGLAAQVQQFDAAIRDLPLPRRFLSVEQQQEIGRRFFASNQKLADEFVRQPLDGMWFAAGAPQRSR